MFSYLSPSPSITNKRLSNFILSVNETTIFTICFITYVLVYKMITLSKLNSNIVTEVTRIVSSKKLEGF